MAAAQIGLIQAGVALQAAVESSLIRHSYFFRLGDAEIEEEDIKLTFELDNTGLNTGSWKFQKEMEYMIARQAI